MDFEKWLKDIRNIVQVRNNYLKHKAGHWHVDDRLNLWSQIGTRIFDSHLELIKKNAIKILTEIDPQFELPEEERFAASIHGKVSKYSSALRKGISETLALLGTNGNKLTNCTLQRPELTATIAIREILQNDDWRVWASLNDVFPVLAEASPEEFLTSLESKFRPRAIPK